MTATVAATPPPTPSTAMQERFGNKEVKVELIPVDQIRESPWNPNVMPVEEYNALKADMNQNGVYGIDAILVGRAKTLLEDPKIPEEGRVTIDGNHRLRAAKALGWKHIRAVFDPSIVDPALARMVSYTKNKERGHIDPFKEAELFQYLAKDKNWKQEAIAKAFNIDRTTVAKRLSLLRIEPEVKEKLTKEVPGVTGSHFEPIATLEPELQKKATKEILEQADVGSVTSEEVQSIVTSVKREAEREKELQDAVAKSQFKVCPKCGKKPVRVDYDQLPWVNCDSYHRWNLNTGKLPAYEERARKVEKLPVKPPVDSFIRSHYTIDDFRKAFTRYTFDVIPELTEISTVTLDGKSRKGRLYVDVDLTIHPISITVERGTKKEIDLEVEPKTFKGKDLKEFKTEVTRSFPRPETEKDLKDLEKQVDTIFSKFPTLKKKRGRPPKEKKRGGRRKSSPSVRGKK